MRHWLSTRQFKLGLLAIAIVPSLTGLLAIPAQANFLDSVRGIFGGNSDSGASSRSRGGAIRNQECKAEEIAASTEEMVALIPDDIAKTTQANPEVLIYIPFDRVRYPQVRLRLELEQEGISTALTSSYYPLPEAPGIVSIQVAENIALGQEYQWEVGMLCERNLEEVVVDDLPPTSVANDGPVDVIENGDSNTGIVLDEFGGDDRAANEGSDNEDIFQAVEGPIQLVESTPDLAETLATNESELHYQAYLEAGIWLDMVTALAANQSPEWVALLEEFELSGIAPTVQSLR
ncbi:MAG: DUF928 domain-containing protein [Cyanobacteria bacterium P01_H01_bin.152]